MAKKAAFVDEVLSRATRRRTGFRPWYELLPPEVQAELEQVRQAFDKTKHQKRSYALAVIEAARERGWKTSGIQGVISWLDRKR